MSNKLTWISGSTVILSGSSVAVSLPSPTPQAIAIRAEGGAVYFEINASGGLISGSATSNASGYVPADNLDVLPEIYNLHTLHLYGASAVKAHLRYFTY